MTVGLCTAIWHELAVLTCSCHRCHSRVMASGASLRERQAAVIRDAILDALADRLDHDDPDDIAMPQVAGRRPGCRCGRCTATSPPGRPCSTRLATTWSRASGCRARSRARTISRRVFLESARRGAPEPAAGPGDARGPGWAAGLARRTAGGGSESITSALAEVTSRLPAERGTQAARGAIVYLCSLPAWVTVSEECGLSAEDAQPGHRLGHRHAGRRAPAKKTRRPGGCLHNPKGRNSK